MLLSRVVVMSDSPIVSIDNNAPAVGDGLHASLRPGRTASVAITASYFCALTLGKMNGLLAILMFVIIGCSCLVYRAIRQSRQLDLNDAMSRRGNLPERFVLYLRPFFAAGRMRTKVTPGRLSDAVVLGHKWDLELALTYALEGRLPLLALGQVQGEFGAAKLAVEDSEWQDAMMRLADNATSIVLVPLNRPSTLWEAVQVYENKHLLRKTLVIMPATTGIVARLGSLIMPGSIRRSWQEARAKLVPAGLQLPTYRSKGALLHFDDSGKPDMALPLRKLAPYWVQYAIDAFSLSSAREKLKEIKKNPIPWPLRIRYLINRLYGTTIFSSSGFKIIVFGGLLVLMFRALVFEPFSIPSGAMAPTILVGDYVFVSKFSYGYSRYSLPLNLPLFSGRILEFHKPERGDVVVFWNSLARPEPVDFIKRIVGLPGDKVQLVLGQVFINDQIVPRNQVDDYIDQMWRNQSVRMRQYIESLPRGPGDPPAEHAILKVGDRGPLDQTPIYEVPPGQYFVMGDNRDNSLDSRVLSAVGFVPAENIVGKAQFLFFSTDGSAAWWQVWKWPSAIRFARLLKRVH